MIPWVDPLAGWTVAITAQRRATEQAELLQHRGADVVMAPLVDSAALDDSAVRAATVELLDGPVDAIVVASGVGLRAWMAMAWTWGLGERLTDLLRCSHVHARGAKAAGALVSEGIDLQRRTPHETMAEVLGELLANGVAGRRIGVQQHGGDMSGFTAALTDAGACVMPVVIYRVGPSSDGPQTHSLSVMARRGGLDGMTFTSPAAVAGLLELEGVTDDLRRHQVVCACVGPVTAAAADRAGLPGIIQASPHRMGSMVRALGERMARRGRSLEVAGVSVRHQGARLDVGGAEVRLTPRERRLLEVMLDTDGAVVSKERLAATVWDTEVDAHTVEVTVNRLRRKLGPAAIALETSNRRGYRIAV